MVHHHPFQCLVFAPPSLTTHPSLATLVAACGSHVLTARANDAAEIPLSKWPSTAEGGADLPKIILLALSSDQIHIVAVTDDKVLRVLLMQPDGKLRELSQRCMPKRPCAVEILPDNSTIICADKFGDVYSLPLLVLDQSGPDTDISGRTTQHSASTPEPDQSHFKPTATTLTVHTQRNRRALEAQMNQKNLTPRKEPLQFKHQLLLGHVSMLTDARHVSRIAEGKQRQYILTADRDEHIRVSRAPPQTHIIEGYCLAHTQYIRSICPIPETDVLVSGGGDSWLGVWDWPLFSLRKKIDLLSALSSRTSSESNAPDTLVNVSGIWAVPVQHNDKYQFGAALICDNVPALFIIPPSALHSQVSEDSSEDLDVIELPANPIAVTSTSDTVIVSLDCRSDNHDRLDAFRLVSLSGSQPGKRISIDRLADSDPLKKILGTMNQHLEEPPADETLDRLLYSSANLRKRTGPQVEEDD